MPTIEAAPVAPRGSVRQAKRLRTVVFLVCGLLVLAGIGFRWMGRNWDEGAFLHPDERFLYMVTSAIETPKSLGAYLDTATSPANPHNKNFSFYVYGTFPIFLTRWFHEHLPRSLGGDVTLLGRAVCAFFDFMTIAVTFLIGRFAFGGVAGALAAAFYALSVLPIQLSHFYTVDPPATFFGSLALYFALLATRRDDKRLPYAFGITAGLAAASKVSLCLITPLFPLALLLRARTERLSLRDTWRQGWAPLAAAAATTFVVFRLFQPYAFTGPGLFGLWLNPKWIANLQEVSRLSAAGLGFPPSVQWVDRPFWFSARHMVRWGFGPPLGLLALVGFGWLAWRLRRRLCGPATIIVLWIAGYFLAFGILTSVKTMRYLLPVYPMLCVAAAALIVQWREVGKQRRAFAFGVAIVTLAMTGAWAYGFAQIYTRPVTRLDASRWIYDHIPGAVTMIVRTANGEHRQPLALSNPSQGRYDIVGSTHYEGDIVALELFHVTKPGEGKPGENPATILKASLTAGSVSRAAEAPLSWSEGQSSIAVRLPIDPPLPVHRDTYFQISIPAVGLTLKRAVVAVETSWDDALPMRVDGYDGYAGIYDGGANLEMYWDENLEKRKRFEDVLGRADVLAISSNRQYATTTRIPSHFPFATAFYRELLGCDKNAEIAECYYAAEPGRLQGRLGFDLVATFESAPGIGVWRWSDQRAEEAFTVYDHPKVLLFRKRPDFNADELKKALGALPLPMGK